MRSIQASLQLTLSKPEPCQDGVCQALLCLHRAVGTRKSQLRQEPKAAKQGWGVGLGSLGRKISLLSEETGVLLQGRLIPASPLSRNHP